MIDLVASDELIDDATDQSGEMLWRLCVRTHDETHACTGEKQIATRHKWQPSTLSSYTPSALHTFRQDVHGQLRPPPLVLDEEGETGEETHEPLCSWCYERLEDPLGHSGGEGGTVHDGVVQAVSGTEGRLEDDDKDTQEGGGT